MVVVGETGDLVPHDDGSAARLHGRAGVSPTSCTETTPERSQQLPCPAW